MENTGRTTACTGGAGVHVEEQKNKSAGQILGAGSLRSVVSALMRNHSIKDSKMGAAFEQGTGNREKISLENNLTD